MKKIITAAVLAAVLAVPCFAELFTPKTFYTYSATKNDKTHVTLGKKAVRFKPSAAITYKINGAGVAYPVAANADEGPFNINSKGTPTRNLVFSIPSSATKTKIYVQEEE